MAFLFKSKKHHNEKAAAATKAGSVNSSHVTGSQSSLPDGSLNAGAGRGSKEHKDAGLSQTPTPTSSVNTSINSFHGNAPSPERQIGHARRAQGSEEMSDLPLRNVHPPTMQAPHPGPNPNLYPWSFRKLTYTSAHPGPFPRYGAAINAVASKEGDIYMMGGLINSATVKGDLWLVEAGGGDLACYPLATHAEGPGPRVGHASLLVGNAFIVYGGDTKIGDSDVLDESLYLLNTSTRQWSRAVPASPRPPGRYGHSLNILGSKIYVFGGQAEGYFMNDLVAFDLNQLQNPSNRWEFLIQNEGNGAIVPPPRTNHSIITYNDKMYLFGGTNGYQWFNDVWCYDPATNGWVELPCIGYIPAAREGHAAALVDDVMYIFGGRTEEGADLGDLAAFRITTRRWYTFQNMGPSPSPRSGHSMTAYGKQIVVLGGEPSTATREATDLSIAYLLDTTKIRYPDKQGAEQQAIDPPMRKLSDSDRRLGGPPPRNAPPSRDGAMMPPDPRRLNGAPPRSSVMGPPNIIANRPNGPPGPNGNNMNAPPTEFGPPHGPGGPGSRLPRTSVMGAPAGPPPPGQAPSRPIGPHGSNGPPPQGLPPNRPNGPPQGGNGPRGKPPVSGRAFGPAVDTSARSASVERDGGHGSPRESPATNGRRTPTSATAQKSAMRQEDHQALEDQAPKDVVALQRSGSKTRRQQGSMDGTNEGTLKSITNNPGSPPTRQGSGASKPRSARNSQTVNLLNELDNVRNKNAWMASELELARKSGYTSGGTPSSIIDNRISTSFSDSERPLIEALIAMRNELANIQGSVDQQAVLAAKKIAEVEKQRDSAISEAVYAKAKLAAHGGSAPGTPLLDGSRETFSRSGDRSQEISKKLAAALGTQRDLQSHIEHLLNEIESEKRSRKLAEDTTNVAQARIAELESYKHHNTGQVEILKAELHQVQIEAREEAARCAEAVAKAQLLEIDMETADAELKEFKGTSKDHDDTFESLREALAASHSMKEILEHKLDAERTQRESIEQQLRKLRIEHEERTSELGHATTKLRDAEEMAEKHAQEASSLRHAVLSGLDRASSRNTSASPTTGSGKLIALQQQTEAANALARKYQAAADAASRKLRTAEERISGLEAYQEQVSREGMSIRKQLQASMREVQTLQAANGDMKAVIADHTRETNALNLQYSTLKNLLGERGISPSSAAARGVISPRLDSPDHQRLREMEQQLLSAQQEHEETKQLHAEQIQEIERAYQEKLSQLESDYGSAISYVKGVEDILQRIKNDLENATQVNAKLRAEVEDLRAKKDADSDAEADWQEERQALRSQISNLQGEIEHSRSEMQKQLDEVKKQLQSATEERKQVVSNHQEVQRQLSESFEQARSDLDQLQGENSLLEQRALDAEQKVALLLDQVETSVDSYRRESHLVDDASTTGKNHTRNLSEEESVSGDSVYSDATARGGDRNSMALDNLASELETLRTQWQSTNKNYRQSQISTFDFDTPVAEGRAAQGFETGPSKNASQSIDSSLTDWRKRLNAEEEAKQEKRSSAAQSPNSKAAPSGSPNNSVI